MTFTPFANQMFANQVQWLVRNADHVLRLPPDLENSTPGIVAITSGTRLCVCLPGAANLDRALARLALPDLAPALAWSEQPNPALDLLLHARGFRESFQPRWMYRSLENPVIVPRRDPDIEIVNARHLPLHALATASAVPYLTTNRPNRVHALATEPGAGRTVIMLVARIASGAWRGRIVGAGIAHIDDPGPYQIAALFNIGVDPRYRRRGIASALVHDLAACANEVGATGLALNATPDGVALYRRLGFADVGVGQTWFAPVRTVATPASQVTVRAAEALGHGEIDDLNPAIARWESMPNGEGPLAFVARFGQDRAAAWLLDHGAAPDVLALWSLGLRDEALQAMIDPAIRDHRTGPDKATPLHEAVRRNDPALLEALLAAGADLSARDATWKSRPLEWATALGRPQMSAMIRRAMGS